MIEPRATYRLQLHAGFTFADAKAALPYLVDLGVSHLYLSPILQAAEGSTHGYDVVDPERISVELGGEAGFIELATAARAAGIGILLDIVPNHMSIAGRNNRWWHDVLENGPSSYYAHYFDVEWGGDDRIVMPILGERYGRAIQSGIVKIIDLGPLDEAAAARRPHANSRLAISAHDSHVLPMSPHSLGMLMRRVADRVGHRELAFIGDALTVLPTPHRHEHESRRRRHRDKTVLFARVATLIDDLAISIALADEVAAINADPAELDVILEAQAYRLAHWTVSANQLSYRRFFDITTLVGLRNEDADVFEASHGKVLELVGKGLVDGLRIDHVDGLRDPETYLKRLAARAPGAWIVVEKILTAGETLPPTWPIDGTTGYELAERMAGLLVDPASEAALTTLFETMTGEPFDPGRASRNARREVMGDALHSELSRLTALAVRACGASPMMRDFTHAEIETALAAILAGYPTYRTYMTADRRSEIDRARLATAVTAAHDMRPDIDGDLLEFLEGILAFEISSEPAFELAQSAQQVTGAVTAKGDEDTVLYRQVRLLARCDVGAELRQYAHAPAVVHQALAATGPRSQLATSTHDTKRSEDVRARIAVISEMPDAWATAVTRWRERADRHWSVPPDRVIEYTLWQTLVGAWPLPLDRAKQYAHKAAREARLRTSWRHPDELYENAVAHWLDGVYDDRGLLAEIGRFVDDIAPHGDRNSLAQLLVKLTAPGVPDLYQGTELRDDSLVDPDNRRPVDLALRASKLRELTDARAHTLPIWAGASADSLGPSETGLSARKLWTIRRVLGLRRKHPARFLGAYRAVTALGPHADRVFAYARGTELLVIVPRLGVHADGWRDTTLEIPSGNWVDVLTDEPRAGGVRTVAELWRAFPISLLTRV
jgi:(1->4)-alpha-D-glucan 1-alpha-D-glucosylmutase